MNCPQCGATVPNGHKSCYLCYSPLTGGVASGQAPQQQNLQPPGTPNLEFTLGPSVSPPQSSGPQPRMTSPGQGYVGSSFPAAAPPAPANVGMPAQNYQAPTKHKRGNAFALSAGGVGVTLIWICVRIALRVWAHEATRERNEQALKPFESGVTAQNLNGSPFRPNQRAREQMQRMQENANASNFAPPPQVSSHIPQMPQMPQIPTTHGPSGLMGGMPGGSPTGMIHGPIGPSGGMIHGPTMSHGPIMQRGPMIPNGPQSFAGPQSDN
jgi:hypothetical protein